MEVVGKAVEREERDESLQNTAGVQRLAVSESKRARTVEPGCNGARDRMARRYECKPELMELKPNT